MIHGSVNDFRAEMIPFEANQVKKLGEKDDNMVLPVMVTTCVVPVNLRFYKYQQ